MKIKEKLEYKIREYQDQNNIEGIIEILKMMIE